MVTAAQKKKAAWNAYVTDVASGKVNADMPVFGYRPDYHSQAEYDYQRLYDMAQRWTQSREPEKALQNFEAANPIMGRKPTAEDFSRALSQWMDYAPTASAGVLSAFAQANLSPDSPGVQEALAYDAAAKAQADATAANYPGSAGQANADESWIETLLSPVRAFTRNALEFAQAPLQAVQGGIAGASGALGIFGATPNPNGPDWGLAAKELAGINPLIAAPLELAGAYGDTPNPWEQTDAGQATLAFLGQPTTSQTLDQITSGGGIHPFSNVDTGDGWLGYDPETGVGLAQRQAVYSTARNKYGEAFTLGRGLFSLATDSPDSTLYKVGSGLVDAAVSIFLDPTIIGGKAKAGLKAAQGARDLAVAVEDSQKIVKSLNEAKAADSAAAAALEVQKAEAQAKLDLLQKQWDKTPQKVKDRALALWDSEKELAATREADQAGHDAWRAAKRDEATLPETDAHFRLTGERQELQDLLDVHEAAQARNTARRTARGHIKVEPDTQVILDDLYAQHTPAGLENKYADLSTDAGMIPEQFPGGILTEAAVGATKRGAKPQWVPSWGKGGEGVAAWAGSKAPVVRDAADEVGDAAQKIDDALFPLVVKGGDRPVKGMTRTEVANGYRALLTDPQYPATFGHLFSYAVETGTTKHLAEALDAAGINAIDNVRPLLQTGDGGTWWAGGLTHQTFDQKVSSAIGREARPDLALNTSLVKERIKAIDSELAKATADRKEQIASTLDRYEAYNALLTSQRLDEQQALVEQLRFQAGLHSTPDLQRYTDGTALYNFLFKGKHGQHAFDTLADMDNAYDVMRVTGWDAETSRRVAQATDRDGILAAIAPEFGLSIDHSVGKISTGLRYKRIKALEQNRFFAAFERATNTFVPMAQRISYSDKDGMVKTLQNYMDFYGMPQDITRDYLNRIINETDEFNQRNHVTGLFDELMGHLIDKADAKKMLGAAGREHLHSVIKDGTRVYRNAEKVGHEYWQERMAADGWAGYILKDGEAVKLPNAHIDSEFAQGGTILPDPQKVMEAMGRITGLIARGEMSQNAYETISKITTDWWRTAMLLRGAYIVRNIAEMQIRMFLEGGQNVFANPLRMAAMASATRTRSPAMERLAAKFKTYDEGIDGTMLKVGKGDEQDLMDVHADFMGTMLDTHSLADNRTYRNLRAQGMTMTRPGEPHFSVGWSHQLMALRGSRVARIAVGDYPASLDDMVKAARKQGQLDEREVVMDWLFNHPDGTRLRDYMGKSSDEMRKIMDDPEGVRQYLWTSPMSVEARIRNMSGEIPNLREFLRTGVLKDDAGKVLWETKGRRLGPLYYTENEKYDDLSSVLRHHFEEKVAGKDIIAPVSIGSGSMFKENRSLVDWFFQKSASMERTSALGPEWKYAYWNEVAKRSHLLDAKSLAEVRAIAKRSLPRTSPVHKVLATAKGDGPLIASDIHAVSGAKAGEHVRDLFYDARRRNAAWHQMRLVFPFGQAWGNTLTTWAKLASKNPQQVYKFGKAWQAAQSTGSQAVYDAFNAVDPFGDVHYDDSQGFMYHDENRGGQLMFRYPMAASPLMGIMGQTQDASLGMSAPVSGLNLAFSGDNPLPGLGPMAVGAIGLTGLQDQPGPIGDMIRGLAFPFGEPDPETGLLEQNVPSWARYAILGAGMAPGGGEAFRRQQQKGALIAAASRNDYGDLTDPANQKRWFADADGIAKIASFIRGFGAFVLPASPVTEWQTKDKAGNWLPIASVAAQYRQMESEYGNDQAIVNLVDQYGEKGLVSLIASTGGEKSLSDDAYKWTLAHPDDAERIGADALALLFPGDTSPVSQAWQKANGMRRDLSWNEKQDAALGLLYRYQIAQVYAAAAKSGWTADEIQQGKDAVLERFGGKVPPRAFDPNYYDNLLASFRAAVNSDAMQDNPAIDGVRQALSVYDAALSSYRESAKDPRATLTGKKAAPWRDELHSALDDILAQNPAAAGAIDTLRNMTEGN